MNRSQINNQVVEVMRGDIFFADLGKDNIVGSEQRGQRPVLIVQNNTGNKFSPTIQVAVITSQLSKAKLPTHVEVGSSQGLLVNSVILTEQIKTIDKQRLTSYIGRLDIETLRKVNRAISISLSVGEYEELNRIYTIIRNKISEIHRIEATIQELDAHELLSESMFKTLYDDMQHKLAVLEKFCSLNDINYLDYYKPLMYADKEMVIMIA